MIIKTEDKKQLKILGILVIVLALVSAINVFKKKGILTQSKNWFIME